MPPQDTPHPEVKLNGTKIPPVDAMRLLGLMIQKDGAGSATVHKLQETVTQVTHLVKMVSSRTHGLKGVLNNLRRYMGVVHLLK